MTSVRFRPTIEAQRTESMESPEIPPQLVPALVYEFSIAWIDPQCGQMWAGQVSKRGYRATPRNDPGLDSRIAI